MEYPQSSAACAQLVFELIAFLRANMDSTTKRKEWTKRNFSLLDQFAHTKDLHTFHKHHSNNREFLWDWTGYVSGFGMVIACESEFKTEIDNHFKHDFEKLLVAPAPVKLFITRAKERYADEIAKALQLKASEDCRIFQPGSMVILYCIDPHTVLGKCKDHVWQFQADGEFRMSPEQFDLKPVPVSAK